MTEAQADILDTLVCFLKQLEFPTGPLRSKAWGAKLGIVHQKIRESLAKKASTFVDYPVLKYGQHDIDVLIRRRAGGDKILLAAEVDTGHLPYGNWVKLMDIRADNKMWIYITHYPQVKELLKESNEKFQEILRWRNEDSSSLGKFVLVLKSPGAFEVVDASQLLQVKQ